MNRSASGKSARSIPSATARKRPAGVDNPRTASDFRESLMEIRQILEPGPGAVGQEVGTHSGHGILDRKIDAPEFLARDPGRRQFLEVVIELDPEGEEMVGRQEAVAAELLGGAPLDFEKEGDRVEDVDRPVAAAEPLGINVIHEGVEGIDPGRDEARAEALGQRFAEVIGRPPLGENHPGSGKIPRRSRAIARRRPRSSPLRGETRLDPGRIHSTSSNRP